MKILIVEDDVVTAQYIYMALQSFKYLPLTPVSSYQTAIEAIDKHKPDLGIFDIELAGYKTGIDLANFVNQKYTMPFIFLTSKTDKEMIDQVKVSNPHSILIKPFQPDELYATIELITYQHFQKEKPNIITESSSKNKFIFIKQKEGHIKVNYTNILYLKSDGVYIDIITNQSSKAYIIRGTIESYLNKLNSDFMRIHRSYIINTAHVEKVLDSTYILINNEHLPIGRKYRNALLHKLNIH